MRYRSKPVEIEAVRFLHSPEERKELFDWMREKRAKAEFISDLDGDRIEVVTLEGTMKALPGDWIIQGTEGEFYPCKPSVFERKYEPVS